MNAYDVAVCGALEGDGVLSLPNGYPGEVELQVHDQAFRSTGRDLHEGLLKVRQQLEAVGSYLCIQAASKYVSHSGMSRQMSGGRRAYRQVGGQPSELVDVLAPAGTEEIVTVAMQEAAKQRRLVELRSRMRDDDDSA